MATKIGGNQINLDDFIKDLQPSDDWTDKNKTASIRAIKKLLDENSGMGEFSGEIYIYNEQPGIYIVKRDTKFYYHVGKFFLCSAGGLAIISGMNSNRTYTIVDAGNAIYSGVTMFEDMHYRVSISPFQGATVDMMGRNGFVPAPNKADVYKFLCGNGQWENPTILLKAKATGYVPGSKEYSFTFEHNGAPISKARIEGCLENGIFIIAQTDDTSFGQYYYPDKDYINNKLDIIFRKISVENGEFICKRLRCVTVNGQEIWYREIELTL